MGQDVEELRTDIERRREDLGETLDAIGDRISPGRMVTRQRNRMSESWRALCDRVMGTASDARGRVSDTAGSVADHMGPDAVRQQTQGSPLGAGLVVFGLGLLAAAALPPTDAEAEMARTVKDKAEPLTEGVTQAGREIVEDLKQEASAKGQELKSTAADAAGEVAGTAKTATDDVRRDVTSSSSNA